MARPSAAEGAPYGRRLGVCAAAWTAEHRLEVGAWRVRYREAGDGPAVVLLHGLGISADYWWRNGPRLAAAGYRVLAPDLPGFGRTEGPPDGLSIPDQMRSLLAWVREMDLPPAVYVGHSISCQTILQLAAEHPERVRGLVLAAPTGDPAPLRLTRQALALALDGPRESWGLVVTVAQAYLRAGVRRTWKTWRAAGHDDALANAARVNAPGVVVVGSRDPVVRPAFARALAARLPEGYVATVEGGAHAVIYDPAEGFNAAVLEFLGRVKR